MDGIELEFLCGVIVQCDMATPELDPMTKTFTSEKEMKTYVLYVKML